MEVEEERRPLQEISNVAGAQRDVGEKGGQKKERAEGQRGEKKESSREKEKVETRGQRGRMTSDIGLEKQKEREVRRDKSRERSPVNRLGCERGVVLGREALGKPNSSSEAIRDWDKKVGLDKVSEFGLESSQDEGFVTDPIPRRPPEVNNPLNRLGGSRPLDPLDQSQMMGLSDVERLLGEQDEEVEGVPETPSAGVSMEGVASGN